MDRRPSSHDVLHQTLRPGIDMRGQTWPSVSGRLWPRAGMGEVARAVAGASFQPQAAAFTALLHTCAKARAWQTALEVFAAMRAHHPAVAPNTVHFSSLISACAAAGRWQEAIQARARRGASTSLPAHVLLLCPTTRTQWVVLSVKQFRPPAVLVYVAVRPWWLVHWMSTLQQLKFRQHFRKIKHCTLLDSAACAVQVFGEMQAAAASDPGCAPNVITYSALMTACCAGGRPDAAQQVFRGMRAAGVQPDHITYSTLLAGARGPAKLGVMGCWARVVPRR